VRSTRLRSSIEDLPVVKGLLGFRPTAVPPHVFAVEPERLSYARFARTTEPRSAESFELAAFHEVALPPKQFLSGLLGGPLREPASFEEALASLLAQVEEPIHEASLVIPDTWLRVTFTDVEELPSDPRKRQEVLRWKLKRQVPFRVEELRLGAVEVEPLPRSEGGEPRRLLLGFALEALLTQMEDAFEKAGVRLGQITSASLALLARLAKPDDGAGTGDSGEDLIGLALVEDGSYTLAFARHGEPVLQRFKGSAAELSEAARGSFVERDLKLTRRFLEEQYPSETVGRVILVCPPEREPEWLEWIETGFGRPVEPLGPRHLPLAPGGLSGSPATTPALRRLAPMLGAVSREVA
jgi:hypothetical protein